MRISESKLRELVRSVIKENKVNEIQDHRFFGTKHDIGRYGTLDDYEFLKKNFEVSNAREYTKQLEHVLRAIGVTSGVAGPVAMTVVSLSTSCLELGLAIGESLVVGSIFCFVLSKLIEVSTGTSGNEHVDAYVKLLNNLKKEEYDKRK